MSAILFPPLASLQAKLTPSSTTNSYSWIQSFPYSFIFISSLLPWKQADYVFLSPVLFTPIIMPYSKLRRKLEPTQLRMTDRLDDLASVPDSEFVELVWENGQVLKQGQSHKTRKSSPGTAFTSHLYKAQDKDEGDDVPKFERIGSNGDSVLNDFSSSGQMGLGQDDELVRWLNYPLDDYCSEFFSEFSGISQNTPSVQNNAVLIDKRNNHGEMIMDPGRASTHGVVNSQGNASKVSGEAHDVTRRYGKLFPSQLEQCQTSLPSHRSRATELNGSSAHQRHYDDQGQNLTSTSGMPNNKTHKQGNDPTGSGQQSSNNAAFMNFSHFLRPATLVKSDQQSAAAATVPGPLLVDGFKSNNKASTLSRSNPIESSVIDSNSVSRSITGFQTQPVSLQGKVDVKSSIHKPPKEPLSMNQSEAICQEHAFSKSKSPDQALGLASSFAASMAIGRPDGENGFEAVVASSSVCSGNRTGAASNDPKLKRKSKDTEESEYRSEDVEEESVGVREPTTGRGGAGAKRSRAAEVHNLSERRRRDRINEKMRALQELIPNCNKVDKASMLDEAIEYLKTLQLQVQILAMGTGLYMPPMMLPPGMQHMHAPNMAPSSPMSVGMGMGLGMGMLNVSGGPSGCPLIQMPPMNGSNFPCPPSSGPSNLPIMAVSNHSMFGQPGQGIPMSMPSAPFVPFSGGSPSSALLPSVSGVANPVEVPSSAAPSCSKDRIEDINTQLLRAAMECSQNQMSIEGQATKEGPEQSSMDHKSDKNSQTSGNEVLTPPCRC